MADNTNRREYDKAYKVENYDQLLVRVKKGKRAEYKSKAAGLGLSLSVLIQRGVESYGVSSEGNVPNQSTLSAEQKIFVDEFSKLPADVQKHFLKVFKAINDLQCSHLPK